MSGAWRISHKLKAGLMILLTVLFAPQPARAEQAVDVELVLAVDTSSSMKPGELVLQRQGYAAAFRSREVIDAIVSGLHRRVAVTYVEWGASGSRRIIVPWMLVAGEADAHRLADLLEATEIANLFQTSISGAIRYGMRAFEENDFRGERRVIDISGDGPNNQGGAVTLSRDAAIGSGISINGLPLMVGGSVLAGPGLPPLDDYYADCVIGGPSAFLLPVRGWDQFPAAVRRKLALELSGDTPRLWHAAAGRQDVVRSISNGETDCGIGERLWRGMEPA